MYSCFTHLRNGHLYITIGPKLKCKLGTSDQRILMLLGYLKELSVAY